jgi:hypothetical protein
VVELQKAGELMSDWRIKHGEVIAAFMAYLNERTDNYVLKGGTNTEFFKMPSFS